MTVFSTMFFVCPRLSSSLFLSFLSSLLLLLLMMICIVVGVRGFVRRNDAITSAVAADNCCERIAILAPDIAVFG